MTSADRYPTPGIKVVVPLTQETSPQYIRSMLREVGALSYVACSAHIADKHAAAK